MQMTYDWKEMLRLYACRSQRWETNEQEEGDGN
jgi:hypothetical protein